MKCELSLRAVEILVELLKQCSFSVADEDSKFLEAKAVYQEAVEALNLWRGTGDR